MSLLDKIISKIKAQDFTITYLEAITLAELRDVGQVKLIWGRDPDDRQYLKGVVLKEFDGLVLQVIEEEDKVETQHKVNEYIEE